MPTGACKWNRTFFNRKRGKKKRKARGVKKHPRAVCNSYTQTPQTHKVAAVAPPGMRRRALTDQFNLGLGGVAGVAATGPAGLMWRTVTL